MLIFSSYLSYFSFIFIRGLVRYRLVQLSIPTGCNHEEWRTILLMNVKIKDKYFYIYQLLIEK